MANLVFMGKTGLTGGEATKLDSIDGATLTDNDAAFVNVSNVQYIYRLDADSGAAESSPDIIAPDTNPGDKRWILQGLNPGLTASLPVFTDASKNLVSNTMTGTGKVVMDTSPTFSASATLSGLTASLPVFTDGSKALVSKSVADTLTALGVGSAAFEAYLTSDVTCSDGAINPITGVDWTEITDTGSCFSQGTFTAPASGLYLFCGSVRLDGISDGNGITTLLKTTAGEYTLSAINPYDVLNSSGVVEFTFSVLVTLSATNTAYLSVTPAGTSGSPEVVGGNRAYTLFCGYRLK